MLGNLETYVGPAAGLATSVLWTATSLFFTAAGKRIGATLVNATRIALAIVLLGVTHRLLFGSWVPDATARQLLFLALSGIVGLSIGDQSLFTAFVYTGPRISMLIMATAPIFAVFFGWVALGETLEGIAWVGIAMTIGGVGWVVLERPHQDILAHSPHRVQGVILAFVAAACQAGGLLLSKQGIGHGWLPRDQHLDPQAATLLRMLFAGVGIAPILLIHRIRQRKLLAAAVLPKLMGSPKAGLMFASFGALVGPYLGVWMSLVAADRAPLGIAQTLCSLTPVIILPFAIYIHKERVSPRAAIGAVVAVAGCAILFFGA